MHVLQTGVGLGAGRGAGAGAGSGAGDGNGGHGTLYVPEQVAAHALPQVQSWVQPGVK